MKLDKILKSKVLYYVALVLMVINVLGYVSLGSTECVVIFGITTYLANMFTKNRSLDILCGLFVANVVFGCGRVKEGFEGVDEKSKKLEAMVETAKKEKRKKMTAQPPADTATVTGKSGSRHTNNKDAKK
tara:strand:+ start:1755 stop:2144 length:390 start_codon:yes stop_codon:yes gene_type:complete